MHRIPNNPGNGNTLEINLIYVRFVCFNVQYSLISFKKPRRQESPEVGEGFLPSALLRQCWLSASDFGSAGQRSLFTLSLLLLQEYTHASIFLITILNKLNRSVFLLFYLLLLIFLSSRFGLFISQHRHRRLTAIVVLLRRRNPVSANCFFSLSLLVPSSNITVSNFRGFWGTKPMYNVNLRVSHERVMANSHLLDSQDRVFGQSLE